MFEGSGDILETSDFVLVPLADLGNWVGGGTPSKLNPSYWENGTIPWVSPKDMKIDHIRAAEDYITELAVNESTTNLVPAGSILVVTRSGILRHTFPVAVADVPVTINQDLKALALKPEIDPKYVAFALRAFSPEILSQCSKQGTTVNSIETQKLLRFEIPLAAYPHQTRIVAEIEKQFSRLDEAVANLKRVKANLKRYKAAVLKAAVEGKLTEEWRMQHPDVEPAGKLLERILAERRKGAGKGKYKKPVAPDTSGLPELPAGWVWASVEQISNVVRGASPRPAGDPRYFDGDVPWITVGPITVDNDPYLRKVPETLTVAGKERSRFIEPHTLLLTNSGATLGVPKISLIGGCINDGVAALLDVEYPTKLYLLYLLRTLTERLRGINQGAAQPNLNTTIIKEIAVPLPPLLEQGRIVAEVERHISIVAGAEAQVDGNLRRADRLRQSILKQAFSGQLVPQGPNDGSVSVLIERIHANENVEAYHVAPRPAPKNRIPTSKRAQHAGPQYEIKLTPAAPNDFTSLDCQW